MEFLEGIPLGNEIAAFLSAAAALVVAAVAYHKNKKKGPTK